ncbi:hypothetical protein PIB30_026625 [Stylosanthes scabra]|uniref:Uncharacterized protein n=1 Tax=Stylosanthes scabra TaxID=79078 RepID=A0ABU6X7Z7_9FABA|nr:hypothetical protein [Stylosanthes scabra]
MVQGAAHLVGLEGAIQFLLEELNLEYGNVTLVSTRRDIVDWIQGKDKVGWESRFIRNKAKNFQMSFNEVKLKYLNEKEFLAKDRWLEMAKMEEERWVTILKLKYVY